MSQTSQQYDSQIKLCRDLFQKKTQDYGTSWRIMRTPSLIDQIFIKAQRLRSIEEKGEQKVNDSIEGEYIGIINYSIITLIQKELGESNEVENDYTNLFRLYDEKAAQAKALMEQKNHDYGEAWREMYISSFTDLILSKLLRIRQILQNKGKTIASEGIDANLYDMINYAVFAMIKLGEKK
ncbi:MAG: DUF1599 domain-containing protein [Sphingobacteriales bacterium]|nr:MAG: DUF1599 domain-containing protein [Sphingobacteriales bacterium]